MVNLMLKNELFFFFNLKGLQRGSITLSPISKEAKNINCLYYAVHKNTFSSSILTNIFSVLCFILFPFTDGFKIAF